MKRRYNKKKITLMVLAVLVLGAAMTLIAVAAGAIRESDEMIAQADAFLERQESYTPHKTPVKTTGSSSRFAPKDRDYTWEMEMCARVVGFEVGLCCDRCKFYVASACVNRMHYWYGDKPVAMITDYSDETGYYMMWPGYAYEDEFYGYSFSEHKDELLPYVWEAEKAAADVWFWDCDDTQGEWAEPVWYCEKDRMWYWR